MKVLQIHPTLKCNSFCHWCAYGRQKYNDELSLEKIYRELSSVHLSGCEMIKISGGGEPTVYGDLIPMLFWARQLGYTVYLQTNGLKLDHLIRQLCCDIRISSGDGKPFVQPEINPNGFSYVVSREPDYDNLNRLIEFAISKGLYVRITQDDTDLENVPTIAEIQSNIARDYESSFINRGVSEANRLAAGDYPIRFWDALDYHRGRNPCPSSESPLLGADGYWYPCCKTHCAQELVEGYNQSMRLGTEYPQTPYDGSDCRRCYY
jgi:molybdenum cofactor biosynthesis enzyme MoaA